MIDKKNKTPCKECAREDCITRYKTIIKPDLPCKAFIRKNNDK
jgi:hypothetical protein